jgi:hypothetical protein
MKITHSDPYNKHIPGNKQRIRFVDRFLIKMIWRIVAATHPSRSFPESREYDAAKEASLAK